MTGCDEDQVCSLASSLQAETGSCYLYEDGRAPSMARAATKNALVILCPDNESSFLEAGDDGYTCRLRSDVIGNAFVGIVH